MDAILRKAEHHLDAKMQLLQSFSPWCLKNEALGQSLWRSSGALSQASQLLI